MVIDLDGTITRTDTLVEGLAQLLKEKPGRALAAFPALLRGRAALKRFVSNETSISPALLPWREELLDYIRSQRATGRRIVLATAADRRVAESVADHLQLFDLILASDGDVNLKGATKLKAIEAHCGSSFVYAGDSSADMAIWRAASAAIVVGSSDRLHSRVEAIKPIERRFKDSGSAMASWSRAIRVHQWLKNLLLFVPLLTSFTFGQVEYLLPAVLAFFAFSFAASATYLLNDFFDLSADRLHPRKRTRPMASGALGVVPGLAASALLLLAAVAIAGLVSSAFLGTLMTYLALTTCYSAFLKRSIVVDVLVLAVLYTLRIVAGAVAVQIPVSSWLLAFSVFMFLSLALVKRCAELVGLRDRGKAVAPGRDYRVGDLDVLWALGVGSALAAAVVFGLFASSPEVRVDTRLPLCSGWSISSCSIGRPGSGSRRSGVRCTTTRSYSLSVTGRVGSQSR